MQMARETKMAIDNILSIDEMMEIRKDVLIQEYGAIWREKSRNLKIAEEEEKEARAKLIDACGEDDFEGHGIAVKKIERKGSIEYTAIPELADVNLEQYRKAGTFYWTVKASVKE